MLAYTPVEYGANVISLSCVSREVNSLPKSEITVLHEPYLINSCVSADVTVNVSLLAMGTVTKYLLNISKHLVTIQIYLPNLKWLSWLCKCSNTWLSVDFCLLALLTVRIWSLLTRYDRANPLKEMLLFYPVNCIIDSCVLFVYLI